MNEIPSIITERVNDIPLLLEQMQRMGLPSLLDDHFPTHGNWQGLSLGAGWPRSGSARLCPGVITDWCTSNPG